MEFDIDDIIEKKTKKAAYFYSQVPQAVWTCKKLTDAAVRLYAAYHGNCKNKQINLGKSMTFISQYKLAGILGWDVRKVQRQQDLLEKEGFIRVEKRGLMMSNYIYLNEIKLNEEPKNAQNASENEFSKQTRNAKETLAPDDTGVVLNRYLKK